MNKIRITILIFFVGISLLAYGQDLVILHTNDTHSQIETFTSGIHKGLGGVERRENYINAIRQQYEGKVILLDAGDFSQGTPYFTIFKGDAEIELMNNLGVDAACLGNHEFDNGVAEIARRAKNANFPMLFANYDVSKSPLKGVVEPYTIIERNGKKIGVIGLTVNLMGLISPNNLKNIKYLHPYKVVNKYARQLRKKGCDLVILLTHCGYEGGTQQNPDDQLIAANTEGVDIIIGGHSHTFIENEKVITNKSGKKVVVVQAGEKGCQVGRLDIWF